MRKNKFMRDHLYRKNEIVRVTIEDMTGDGEGIGHVDGYTLFVKDAVIGDEIRARRPGAAAAAAFRSSTMRSS